MLTLAGERRDRAADRQGRQRGALLPGLRVTVWATSQKGGALVATRVRIEP